MTERLEGWASKSIKRVTRKQEFEQQAGTLSTMELPELTCPGLGMSIMSSGKQVFSSGGGSLGTDSPGAGVLESSALSLVSCPVLCSPLGLVLPSGSAPFAGGVGGGRGGAGFSPPWKNATST